jgi:hypothetical protein
MKKLFITAAIVVGIGAIGRRVVAHCTETDRAARLEALPDTAPPKWFFTNATAIRENTDHIRATLDAAATEAVPEGLSRAV